MYTFHTSLYVCVTLFSKRTGTIKDYFTMLTLLLLSSCAILAVRAAATPRDADAVVGAGTPIV